MTSAQKLRYTGDRFLGRLTSDGMLQIVTDGGAAFPEVHLNCSILMRGYIANRADLSGRLGIYGAGTASDAKLLAGAFRRWGSSLQVHVLGEYAACIFDLAERTALLTHDALGLVQLVYSSDEGGISFGTHLLDVLDLIQDRRIDEGYIASYLATGQVTTERTPYKSVYRLLPGMSLRWAPDRYRTVRTWDLADTEPLECKDDREYEERFKSLLEAALRATVDEVGVTWVALSGGLDSSSVLCVAGKLGMQNVGAYSFIAPHHPESDEQQWAQAAVEQFGSSWRTVDVETVLPFSAPPDNSFYEGEPTLAAVDVKGRQLLNDLSSSAGVTTILTGHGGDAVLGSYPGSIPPHAVDLLFAGRPVEAFVALREWKARNHERRSWSFLISRAIFEPTVAHLSGNKFESSRPLPLPPWIEPCYSRDMKLPVESRKRSATRDWYPGRQQIWDSVWTHSLSAGRPSSNAGYDVRRPLLYRPFLEFMYAVPGEQRIQPDCDRYLHRRALKGILPESVRRRGRKVFGTWAYVEGLSRSPSWREYLCDDPQIVRLGITSAAAWRKAVQQASVGHTAGDRFFFSGVALEAWLKGLKLWCPQRRTYR